MVIFLGSLAIACALGMLLVAFARISRTPPKALVLPALILLAGGIAEIAAAREARYTTLAILLTVWSVVATGKLLKRRADTIGRSALERQDRAIRDRGQYP